jgi:hypothetical protein
MRDVVEGTPDLKMITNIWYCFVVNLVKDGVKGQLVYEENLNLLFAVGETTIVSIVTHLGVVGKVRAKLCLVLPVSVERFNLEMYIFSTLLWDRRQHSPYEQVDKFDEPHISLS